MVGKTASALTWMTRPLQLVQFETAAAHRQLRTMITSRPLSSVYGPQATPKVPVQSSNEISPIREIESNLLPTAQQVKRAVSQFLSCGAQSSGSAKRGEFGRPEICSLDERSHLHSRGNCTGDERAATRRPAVDASAIIPTARTPCSQTVDWWRQDHSPWRHGQY
jgi:hypothetical protein